MHGPDRALLLINPFRIYRADRSADTPCIAKYLSSGRTTGRMALIDKRNPLIEREREGEEEGERDIPMILSLNLRRSSWQA